MLACAAAALLGYVPQLWSQDTAPASPRDAAPIDITGNWVAIINEEWRWRMLTPPKGDTMSVQPLNDAGRAETDRWDPASDGSCRAYGAGALLRMPTRLQIEWADQTTLVLRADAGQQTRQLRFAAPGPAAAGPRTLQGVSHAQWQYAMGTPRGRAAGGTFAQGGRDLGGSLVVTTTHLLAGWLRRNGVPYSDQTTLTEYFDRFPSPNGDEWLMVTTIVEDPVYLNGPFVTSSHFKREPDDSKWNPSPCRADL